MKKNNSFSPQHNIYIKKIRKDKFIVVFLRVAILILFLGLWEFFASFGIYDPFITSSPSRIAVTIKRLFIENNLIYHIGITLLETFLGFLIAVIAGYFVALALWWSISPLIATSRTELCISHTTEFLSVNSRYNLEFTLL